MSTGWIYMKAVSAALSVSVMQRCFVCFIVNSVLYVVNLGVLITFFYFLVNMVIGNYCHSYQLSLTDWQKRVFLA